MALKMIDRKKRPAERACHSLRGGATDEQRRGQTRTVGRSECIDFTDTDTRFTERGAETLA